MRIKSKSIINYENKGKPILKETRLDLILHPVRIRIVMALAGQQKSPAELGELLGDVPQATLYRHIQKLVAGGLLEVVAERRVRNTVERIYSLKPGSAYLSLGEAGQLTREDHLRGFVSYLLGLLDDYARFIREADLPDDLNRMGFQKLAFYVSPEEFQAFNQLMNESLAPQLAKGPAPGRTRQLLALITLPDVTLSPDAGDAETALPDASWPETN